MKQYRQKGSWSGEGAIILGVGCALLVSIMGIMGGTALVNAQILPESGFGWLSVIVPFIGVLSGTVVPNIVAGNFNLVSSLVIGSVYLLILVAACIMFFDGCFVDVWRQLIGVLAGMIPSVLHGLGIAPAKKPKYRYKK